MEAPFGGAGSADDGELLHRCRGGDRAAWAELVDRHASLVNAILRGSFRLSEHDAEDAFQEVYTRLYLHLDAIRDGRGVRGWIAQVTRNVALDHLRRRKHEGPGEAALAETAFEEPLRELEEALSIRAALDNLPESQREVLERFFVRDESYRAIASALGIPPGTIASRISRALTALRAELEGDGRPQAARAS